MYRRMKKNAMRTRISPARPVRNQRSVGSAKRARDDRSVIERPPRAGVRVPASIARFSPLRRAAADGRAVALQAVHLGLGLALDRVRQGRVLELRSDLLAVAERVAEPVLHELGLVLLDTGLAHVLPDEQERDRSDRVRLVALGVDRAEAEVGGRRDAGRGRRRRLQRRLDVVAGLVLDGRRRELVLQRVRLLDVAHGALGLLDTAGDAVVAL